MSIIELLFTLGFFYLIFGIPAAMILMRAGFRGWWSIVVAVPILNVIALWIFAFMEWPALSVGNDMPDQSGSR